MKHLILIVEDEAPIRKLIESSLKSRDYRTLSAASGAEALQRAVSHNPDILLLDLGLPDRDGVSIIEEIRGWSEMPIIVVSARAEDSDKIAALDAGADDYLTKPFSVDELLARVRVSERRLGLIAERKNLKQDNLKNGPLRIDQEAGLAYLNDQELKLTPIEYKLLSLLMQHCGKVLTHSFITRSVWGSGWESELGSLRVFMATLRKKLEKNPAAPKFIQTHVGVGYRMQRVDSERSGEGS